MIEKINPTIAILRIDGRKKRFLKKLKKNLKRLKKRLLRKNLKKKR